MIEPSNVERSEWPDATRAYVEALEATEHRDEQIAERLMKMAARVSVQSQFGWTHPDCETLQAAASTLRGAPERPREKVMTDKMSPVATEAMHDLMKPILDAKDNRIAELEARLAEVAHAYDVTFKRRTELELAILPFAEFAEHAVDAEERVWKDGVQRDPVSTWFGPSDFSAVAKLKA